jgi:hypothetical protein
VAEIIARNTSGGHCRGGVDCAVSARPWGMLSLRDSHKPIAVYSR